MEVRFATEPDERERPRLAAGERFFECGFRPRELVLLRQDSPEISWQVSSSRSQYIALGISAALRLATALD